MEYLLPNGNDLLGALRPGKIIRRKITVLDNFVDHETWFSWTKEKRHEMMAGALSTADGLYLSVIEMWARFRGSGGELEMDIGNGWKPFPWPKRNRG